MMILTLAGAVVRASTRQPPVGPARIPAIAMGGSVRPALTFITNPDWPSLYPVERKGWLLTPR